MNYLSIDYGLKHTGLAIATTPLAEPLKTIPTAEIFVLLPEIIADNQIETLVIGISEGEMAQKTQAFAKKLSEKIATPIVFQDETLTSHQANAKLRTAKKKTRSGPDHHFAAAIILQDHLDTQTND